MAKQTVIFFCILLSSSCLSHPVSEANPSNVTLTVESVPVKSGGSSFLQRLNVQVGSAWNKFKCQFYSKATVPVAKMLNVNVPSAMDLANVTNCVQLNAIVSRLTANATEESAKDPVTSTTQSEVESTTVSQDTTTSGESTTETGTTSESSSNEPDSTSESNETAASEESSTSAGATAAPPETTMAITSDDTSQSTIAESDNSSEPSVKPVGEAQN